MPESELTALRGLGARRAALLSGAGINTFGDLARFYPLSYRDLDDITPIAEARFGDPLIIEGRVCGESRRAFFGKMCTVTARIEDQSGSLQAVWFNQPWLSFRDGQQLKLYGRVEYRRAVKQITSPQQCHGHGIEPLYKRIQGIPDSTLREWISVAVQREAAERPEPLPDAVRHRHGLVTWAEAITQIHAPESRPKLIAAKRYIAFYRLLTYQLALSSMRERQAADAVSAAIAVDSDAVWRDFVGCWPYSPTGAQKRVIEAVLSDMAAPQAMARLVQGDVGCGKTAVAFAAIYAAVKAGVQAALMAPTEVLARQHYENALKTLGSHGISCVLLTGAVTGAARRSALEGLRSGSIQLAIGTHALISDNVEYANLGLVITDEQHRFGVRQRTRLAEKGGSPNVLVMSATPIPRTLALVLYGDLDVSVIDELPPGRTPVRTRMVPSEKLDAMYGFIRAQLDAGRQAYFVCPLVEDSEEVDATSAQQLYDDIRIKKLPGVRAELLHGRMKPADKDAALERFRAGETQLLVSTTVIEVGVNVPNATIMVILNAERFGLSQLHQLRGRVGRGSGESWCFLPASQAQRDERLAAFCSTNDGFEIAQLDLQQRGAGELIGARQSGEDSVFGSLLAAGPELIEATHDEARALLKDNSPESRAVVAEARRLFELETAKYGVN